jgi:hypothetical protein
MRLSRARLDHAVPRQNKKRHECCGPNGGGGHKYLVRFHVLLLLGAEYPPEALQPLQPHHTIGRHEHRTSVNAYAKAAHGLPHEDMSIRQELIMTSRYGEKASTKVAKAMHAMKEGTLKSGRSGKWVTDPKQAIAIGLSEAKKEGGKVPPKKRH